MHLRKTALVLIDMQKESKFGIENVDNIAQKCKILIDECRALQIPIIYTRQINRSDQHALLRNEPLDKDNKPVFYRSDSAAIEIIDDIKPDENDIVIDKYRWSGFYGTGLDLILRDLDIEDIILGGFVTDGCVMSSAADAFFRGYNTHLVKDICSATNEGAHMSSILIMANWIYNIRIYNNNEIIKKLNGNFHRVWKPTYPDQLHFNSENMKSIFQKLDDEAITESQQN